MTYIVAFHCVQGLVMCADTQEMYGENKEYTEKLYLVEDQSYPLAIGGAGIDKIIEPFQQELIERVKAKRPLMKSDLLAVIKASMRYVYKHDVPVSVIPEQLRIPEIIVAAKPPNDGFCLFRVKGKRVYPVEKHVIVGYATSANLALLNRFYRDDLPMQQGVMLALYLVSQSKLLDAYVGGDTSVIVVTANGAWRDDKEYLNVSEARVHEFLTLTDGLFLDAIDMSIAPSSFSAKLAEFTKRVDQLRQKYLEYTAAHTLNLAFHDPNHKGEPYPKIFLGAVTTVMGDRTVRVTEETEEERQWVKGIVAMGRSAIRVHRCEGCQEMLEYMLAYEGGDPIDAALVCPMCKTSKVIGWTVSRVRKAGDEAWIEA